MVALLAINSISVLAQIIIYFFWPVFAMFVVAYLAGFRLEVPALWRSVRV
jgi:hypothetical protein